MDERLIRALFTAYPLNTFPLYLLQIIGVICFIKLPREKKANIHYLLPFFILSFTFFYETLGAYLNYNHELKYAINAYLGNTVYPKFNLFLFNIANRQIGTILYLILIKSWLHPSKKKYITWMIYIFIVLALVLQITGMELLYLQQPIIFSIGANMILIASGIYFTGLMTHKAYLDRNPLKLLSFWQVTSMLFTYTLTYISSVSLIYLYEVNPVLGRALSNINTVMTIITLGVLTLIIASPLLPNTFEKEPFYESN
tara:strand:+ start:88483 stop:89250 length:768 start_codon:yes stop_codon:yes gene_type:complete